MTLLNTFGVGGCEKGTLPSHYVRAFSNVPEGTKFAAGRGVTEHKA